MIRKLLLLFIVIWGSPSQAFGQDVPVFRAVEIDAKVEIGYGLTIGDVDGDKKPDILLADKSSIVWYQNPTWKKYTIAEKLTILDHV
ncbi:MAG: FG-GAP repeat protein, partial [Pyrinomonadaceae bacterium]|nr:FG-GAP repeat protein [Pyrinomonadaceae bacterium]